MPCSTRQLTLGSCLFASLNIKIWWLNLRHSINILTKIRILIYPVILTESNESDTNQEEISDENTTQEEIDHTYDQFLNLLGETMLKRILNL